MGDLTTAAARRIGLAALLLLLGLFGAALIGGSVFPDTAAAAKCLDCEGEEEEPPGEEEEELLAYTLTIHVSGIGVVKEGSTTYCQSSTPAGNTCEREVLEGEVVTLAATAGGGMTFVGWGGDCTVTAGACEVTMDEERAVFANFADQTPPAAPTITSPSEGTHFDAIAEAPIEVTFNNSGDGSTVSYLCSLDVSFGGVPCSSPWTTPKLSSGSHTVYVWAKDAAGNISAPDSSTFSFGVIGPGEEEPPKEEGGSGTGGSGSGTTGGSPTITTPPPLGSSRIDPRLIAKWRFDGDQTIFRKFLLKRLPEGAKVVVTCGGKSCPFKRRQAKGKTVNLTPFLRGYPLDPATKLRFRITAPGRETLAFALETRPGKPPKALPVKFS